MKQTKRLLSIVLMLTMLLSMFTVMASATDLCIVSEKSNVEIEHTRNNWSSIHNATPATCTEDGNYWYAHCDDCSKWCWNEKNATTDFWHTTDTEPTEAAKIPATGHDTKEVREDGYKPYAECLTCGKLFAVDEHGIPDFKNPHSNKEDFKETSSAPASCEHNLTKYPEGDGYWAHAYCSICKKYFALDERNEIMPSTATDNKDAFKQPIVDKTEAKYTVTVKISNASRGTVQVKDHGEWVTVENGDKLTGKSKDAILEFRATDYTTSKYYVEWTYGRKTTTGASKEITIIGDSTLTVSFEKKSPSHSHNFVEKYNDTYHWKECSCGSTSGKEKHDLKTYYKNGYYYTYCKDCDYDSWDYYYSKDHTSSHTGYDYEDYNATYHWKECKTCDYAVKEYHTWVKNTASKTKSSYPYVCKYCGRLSKTNDSCYLPFHDVNDSYWYYDDVLYAYLNGLMDGISVNDFGATQNTTRAQVVTILWRLTGEPRATRENKFKDVSSSAYYNNAISWAVDAGIVDGFDAYTFKPNDNVTREQLAAILYRYAAYMNLSTYGASNLLKFDDYYSIGTWARDAMAWANYHGLINGVGYSKIDPKGYATRAQVAAILHRFAVEFA